MSNLNTSVKFDVLRGWPWGGAIEESFVPNGTTVFKEGQLVALNSSGNLVVAPAVPVTSGASPAQPVQLRMVIQGNDQFDGSFVGKCVTLRGAFTIKTEKYTGTQPAKGAYVSWDTTAGSEGFLKTAGATEQWVGQVEETETNAITVAMKL
jgi:hypothetical protein